MAILINKDTRVLVQGITGRVGSFQTKIMLDYGTKILAGVREKITGYGRLLSQL